VKAVPLLDLKAQFAPLREEISAAVNSVIESQQFVLGQRVETFEQALACYTGAAHAIGCASGTDALILALAASDVGEGDEVLTTPFSFFSTASCAYKVGARPVFCDIEPGTFNIDPARVEDAWTERTRVLLPVHLFGQCADLEPLLDLAKARGAVVIEDAAQALGARYIGTAGDARHAGTVGRIGCYSFFPTKNLGGFGDGGALVCDDEELADRLRQLRVHGGQQMYHHRWVGWNSRLDALQAAVLEIKLAHLDSWSDGRAANAERYDRWFTECGLVARGSVTLPVRTAGSTHIFNQYTIRVEDRDGLRKHLAENAIGQSVYYPVPLHLQECFADLGCRRGQFPVAEQACREVLALPIYPELAEEQQRRVVEAVAAYY
jgi:dTDP-4-amino-4,6-dideoxygalactose transaminase